MKVGSVQGVQYKGYLPAFVIPASALVFGSVIGHFLGTSTGLSGADIALGMVSLISASFLSFKRFNHRDSSAAIEIEHIFSNPLRLRSFRGL